MMNNYNSLSYRTVTRFKRPWQKKLAMLVFFVMFSVLGANAQVDVTATGGIPAVSYGTLKSAFDAVNAGTHTGTITIGISANITETATASLNASGSGAASYTSIVISPTGGAARTITGAIVAGSPLVTLNGADNVTFNGLKTGGNSLTLSNTTASATSGTSTIMFIGGATNNTITNCSVLGSFSGSAATNGGNIFLSTDAVTTNGNDNNTISNNDIGPAGANLSTKGVYLNGSTGTAALNNSGNIINNNNIFDYFGAAVTSAGVYIGGGTTDNNVTNNRFYQTATRTQTTGAQHSAIWIANTSGNNFQVTGNTIGYSSSTATGTYTYVTVSSSSVVPIFLSVGSTTASVASSNTITAIAISGATSGTSSSAPFRGIYVSSGLVTANSNTIGSQSATGAITYTSSSASASDVIGIGNFGSANFITNNNLIGGITAGNSSTGAANIYGLRVGTSSAATWTATGNTIGGTVANSINSTSTATGTIVNGILNSSPISTITGNTVRNMTVAGGTGTGTSSAMAGIISTTTSVNNTIGSNTIYNLNSTLAGASVVNGIYYTASTGTNTIEKNFIYGLDAANTAATINGILAVGGTVTYRNNMIRLGVSGTADATGVSINGISETGGTNNFWFNSVYIGGAPTAAASNTFAFNSTVTANTRLYQNNIFFNARSNAGSTGKHYAICVGGTAANPAGLTSNYNILFANGTGGFTGLFNAVDQTTLANWRTATGQDAVSFSSDPMFIDPAGTTPNLHINTGISTFAEGLGVAIGSVTDDFDGNTRASLTPTDIGADAFAGIGPIALSLNSVSVSPTTVSCTAVAHTVTANTTAGDNPITSVTLNYSFNGVAQTPIAMTGGSTTGTSSWTAVIPVPTPANATVTWSVTAVDPLTAKNTSGTSYADEPLLGAVALATSSSSASCSASPVTLVAATNKTGSINVGVGATTSSTYPDPFYTNWGHSKNQYLILASELTAAGIGAGNIASLGITVTSGTTALTNFSVQMANTTATDMLAFVSPSFTSVYSNPSLAPVVGLNTLSFSTPFFWDGTSNVVIQTCFGNGNTTTVNNTVRADNTSFVSVAHWNVTSTTNASTTCGQTVPTNTYSVRPLFTFGNPGLVMNSYSWSDGTTVIGTTNPLIVSPSVTTTYTVTQTLSGCTNTASTTVTVNPLPTAPTATNSVQCGIQVPTASVADPNGFTTPTFKWYATNVSTPALQSSTATTYGVSINTTTTFYVSVINPATGCESARTPVTVTVNTPDSISAATSSASACMGTSYTLTATNTAGSPTQNYTYSWVSTTPGSGATTPVSGNPVSITPTNPGTYIYTVSGIDGSCSTTATVTVTVNPLPAFASATATPATMCNGGISTLTAAIAPLAFTTGTGATLDPMVGATTVLNPSNDDTVTAAPANIGFSFSLNGTAYTQYSVSPDGWVLLGGTTASNQFTNAITSTTNIPKLYPYWDDLATGTDGGVKTLVTGTAPNRIFIVEWFVTIPRATGGAANSRFQAWLYETSNKVEYRYGTMGAQNSNSISAGYTVNATNYGSITYSTNSLSVTTANDANNSVPASGTYYSFLPAAPTAAITWSPTTNLFTDAGATTAYTGTAAATVYAKPSTTTVYTATATSPATCAATQAVTVNVNPLPTAPTATNSSQCGAGVPTASVADPNVFTTPTFKWYAAATGGSALQSSTSATYTTSVSGTTTFYVSVTNPTTGCESTRTAVTVTFVAADPITITPSTTSTCPNNAITLDAASLNAGYVYTWTANPVAGSGIATSLTGASVSVTPTQGGTYVYTVSGTDGNCTNTNTVSITIIAPVVQAVASPATICAGATVTLTATTPLVATGTTNVGTDNTTRLTTTGVPYRTGAGIGANVKNQYLITASELTAAGMYPGNITSVGFTTISVTGVMSNLSFRLALVAPATTVLTSTFLTPTFTDVLTVPSYTPVVGLNTHALTTPLNWDGTSNLLLEVCGTVDSGSGCTMATTSTTGVTTVTSTSTCAATTGSTASGRPVITLGGQVATYGPGTLVYTWNPGGLTGSSVTVNPTTTTTYTVSAFDSNTGCTTNKDVVVTVNPIPAAPTGTDSTQCGVKAPTASVADPNGITGPVFNWYADNVTMTALQSGTSTTYNTAISATTTFYVSVSNPATGCESGRTPVTVTYTQPDALVLSPGATATGCSNQPLVLSVSSANTNYVYTWTASPAAGSGIATSVTGASPSITPTAAGTYVYTISATDGNCTISSAITATISATPSTISIVQTGSTCLGQVVTLTANGGTAPSSIVVGTGTALNSTTGYPAPYSNYYGGTKHQMIIRASELSALGLASGTQISSIGMNVSGVGSSFTGSLSNFQISMKNTSTSVLTSASFESGLTTVFGPTTQAIPTTGLPATVTHTFSTPFTWDGTSNIVIETAYSNANAGAVNDNVTMTNSDPGFVSTNWYIADSASAASILSAATPSSSGNARPNITLGYISNVALTWSPTTELYTDAAGTIAYTGQSAAVVYAKVTTARSYDATATAGSCSTSSTTTVTPVALPAFTVEDATICKGGSAVLTAVGAGNSFTWSPATGLSSTSGTSVTASPTVATTYTVTATNNTTGCQNTKTVTVSVNDPVTISSIDPINSTVAIGQNAIFTVTATGTGLTYQWYESQDAGGSWNPISGETASVLTLASVTEDMNGYMYQVIVTGTAPCLPETSDPATLNVDTTGIIQQPASLTVCAANPASFTTVASSSDPEQEITYSWEVNAGSGFISVVDGPDATLAGYTFTGAETGTLTLTSTSPAITGLVVHTIVNGYIFSSDAILTVKTPVAITTTTIPDQTVCSSGGTASFAVSATGDNLTYQWQVSTNGGGSWSNLSNGTGIAGATTATLTLTNPAISANGNQYRAVVGGAAQCAAATSVSGTLLINNPAVSSQPVAATAPVGTTVNYSVATLASSPTYQWQYATAVGGPYAAVVDNTPAGVTYTNATTATLSVNVGATATASAARFYRAVINSGGCTVNSNGAQLTITTYCASAATSSGDEDITAVTFGTLNNTSVCASLTGSQGTATGTADRYSNFRSTVPAPSIQAGVSTPISVEITECGGSAFGHSVRIYFDFNHNGLLTDAGEEFIIWPYASSNTHTINATVLVPATALAGTTIMRVVAKESSTTGPCLSSSWGETEDYTVNLLAAPACSGTPNTPVASSDAGAGSVCNGTVVAFSLNGLQGELGFTYQWYSRTLPSGTFAAISGASTSTYSAAVNASSEYYAIVTCSNTGLTSTSNTLAITTKNCDYAVTRNNITYSSIISTGTTYASMTDSGGGASTGGDDLRTNVVSLTGTTFKYQDTPITGFYATTNGWMTFNTGQTSVSLTNDLTATGQNNVLAPFWDDLVMQGNAYANKDASMRYKINGTLGSGTADIIIEWAEMERYSYADPNLNFQVVLHESDNSIEYNYGTMQLFNGASNNTGSGFYTYSVGMNGASPATATTANRLMLQNENSANFAATPVQNSLKASPSCGSQLRFVPAATYSGGAAPAAIPANDEVATAITLPVNVDPCASLCGTIYTSKNATASTGITACSATTPGTPDDDVFFKFTTDAAVTSYRIAVTASTGYRAVVQLFDNNMVPVTCVNTATAGLSQVISSVTLNTSSQYYMRIYDSASGSAGGSTGSGEFGVCISQVLPPPAYDEPAGALTLTVGTTCTPVSSVPSEVLRTTATSGVQVCNAATAGVADDDVWYKFTTPALSTGTTYTINVQGVSTYNPVLQLFAGVPSASNSVACVNATNNGGLETYTSSALLSNTDYYVRIYHSGAGAANGSFSVCVSATVPGCVASPSSPADGASTCLSATPTTLSWAAVSSASGYDVYLDNGSATTLVSTNQAALSYTTPSALSGGTYSWKVIPRNAYGSATACSTFTFTVYNKPSVTAPPAQAFCSGSLTSPITLSGTPSGLSYDITGGSAVGLSNLAGVTSIPSFNPVVGSATVTITPQANGCAGTPVTFTITVSPQTVAGTVSGGTTIDAGSTSGVLTLSGHTGSVVRWESSVSPFSTWTPIANTSTTYTSVALSQTTQFRAVVKSANCSELISASTTVTVNAAVTFTSVTSAQVCPNSEAVVTMNGLIANSTSTVSYTKSGVAQTPVVVVANGSGTGTFNVLVTAAGQNVTITSIVRTDITPNATLTPSSNNSVTFVLATGCTIVQPAQCGITLATIDSYVYANLVSGAQGYRWRVTTLTGPTAPQVQSITTSLRNLRLTQLGSYAFDTQYQVEVSVLKNGVWGPYGTPCNVTTPAATTQLSTCGQTLTAMTNVIYANAVSFASGYRFRISDPLNPLVFQVLDRSVREFRMNLITDFAVQYGKTYNVEVAVKNTNGSYLPYGPVCTVTTPSFPTTSLEDAQCDDYAVPTMGTQIFAISYPGVLSYVFHLNGPGLPAAGAEVTKSLRAFKLSDFTGLVAGATYNVKVRLIFNDTDIPGPYGKTCTLIVPAASRMVAAEFSAVAYPNPFAENFNIDVKTSAEANVDVKVYDMTGRLLESHSVHVSEVESLKVGDRYPSGVYNVIVSQGDNVKTLRVIKR